MLIPLLENRRYCNKATRKSKGMIGILGASVIALLGVAQYTRYASSFSAMIASEDTKNISSAYISYNNDYGHMSINSSTYVPFDNSSDHMNIASTYDSFDNSSEHTSDNSSTYISFDSSSEHSSNKSPTYVSFNKSSEDTITSANDSFQNLLRQHDLDLHGKIASWKWEDHRIPSNESREIFELYRQKTPVIVDPVTKKIRPQKELNYRGTAGLGHRLIRQSTLFHTARIQGLPHMTVSWGWECKNNSEGNPDIFDNLFGQGPMTTELVANDFLEDTLFGTLGNSDQKWHLQPPSEFKGMWKVDISTETRVVNEISRYADIKQRCSNHRLIYEKTVSDVLFYHQLRALFRFNNRIRAFAKEHSFSDRLVLGIHIRAGNGEVRQFSDSNRGIYDTDGWIKNAAKSTKKLADQMAKHRPHLSKPPLLYVATDERQYLEKLANATKPYGFVTTSFPQHYLRAGEGHTAMKAGPYCHENWVAQVIDSIVLGSSDAIVAARYSSFSQTLPMYTLFEDSILHERPPGFIPKDIATYGLLKGVHQVNDISNHPELYAKRLFCESNMLGDKFLCFHDFFQWLWSVDPPRGVHRMEKQRIGNQTFSMRYRKMNQYPYSCR